MVEGNLDLCPKNINFLQVKKALFYVFVNLDKAFNKSAKRSGLVGIDNSRV